MKDRHLYILFPRLLPHVHGTCIFFSKSYSIRIRRLYSIVYTFSRNTFFLQPSRAAAAAARCPRPTALGWPPWAGGPAWPPWTPAGRQLWWKGDMCHTNPGRLAQLIRRHIIEWGQFVWCVAVFMTKNNLFGNSLCAIFDISNLCSKLFATTVRYVHVYCVADHIVNHNFIQIEISLLILKQCPN